MKRATHAWVALAVAVGATMLLERVRVEAPAPEDAVATAEPIEVRIEIERIEIAPEREPLPATRPEPPPPPRPAPPREPPVASVAAPAAPVPVSPGADVVARGRSILESGRFPRMRATYDRIGFETYRDEMTRLGGRFFLFDERERRPVAQVDPASGRILDTQLDRDLSRWPRDVTRHVRPALASGRERFGERASRVILLPPTELDAALLGALDAHLRERGIEPDRVTRFDVAYEMRSPGLHCEVLAVAMRDGTERGLSLVVDLSGGGSGS